MWLLPSLDRIEKLKHCLIAAKVTETSTPCLIIVDKNDWLKNEAAYLELKDLFPNDGWDYRVTEAVSFGGKVREVWDETKDCEWVGVLNDDFHFESKGWDKALVARIDGKNFVSSNDRWNAPMRATTATAWSMPLLKAVGWPIFPPQIDHLHIDSIWEALGRATGCWRVVMSAIVEHRHVLKGHEADSTHQKVYAEYFKAQLAGVKPLEDQLFEKFMAEEFPGVVQKIKDFQDYLPGELYNPNRKGMNPSCAWPTP